MARLWRIRQILHIYRIFFKYRKITHRSANRPALPRRVSRFCKMSDAQERMFLETETDFGLSMLRQAPANDSLVVSPLSVIFALAMIQAGSRGDTKAQIDSLLTKDGNGSDLVEHYSKLSKEIKEANDGVQSRIANGFFLNKDFEIESEYEKTVSEKYSAKVEAHDFSDAEHTAQTIDGFISNATEGKIHDMVNADTVQGAFSLIVNAIYFTAKWQNEFYSTSNTKQNFFSSESINREIDFMNDHEVDRLYADDDDFQVLSLPYTDTSYAFNIFLPKKRFGLEEAKKSLDGAKIQNLLSSLHEVYLSITIPKMTIESDYKLKDALMQMGVSDMFSENADLSGITASAPLKISDAAHRAIIEVNEEGTTAAATTFVKVVPMRLREDQAIPFVADHPFLFVLTKDKNPLFMGQFL